MANDRTRQRRKRSHDEVILDGNIFSVSALYGKFRRSMAVFAAMVLTSVLTVTMVIPYLSMAATMSVSSGIWTGTLVPGYSMGGLNLTAYGVNLNTWAKSKTTKVFESNYGFWNTTRAKGIKVDNVAPGSPVSGSMSTTDIANVWKSITGKSGYSTNQQNGTTNNNQTDSVMPYRTETDSNYWNNLSPDSASSSTPSINVSLYPDFVVLTKDESGRISLVTNPDDASSAQDTSTQSIVISKGNSDTKLEAKGTAVPYYVPLSAISDAYGITEPSQTMDDLITAIAQDNGAKLQNAMSTNLLDGTEYSPLNSDTESEPSKAFNPYPYTMVFSRNDQSNTVVSGMYSNDEAYVYFSPTSMFNAYTTLKTEYDQLTANSNQDIAQHNAAAIFRLGYYQAALAIIEAYLSEALPQDMTRGYVGSIEDTRITGNNLNALGGDTESLNMSDIFGSGKTGGSPSDFQRIPYATLMYDVANHLVRSGETSGGKKYQLAETNAMMDTLSTFGYANTTMPEPEMGVMSGMNADFTFNRMNMFTAYTNDAEADTKDIGTGLKTTQTDANSQYNTGIYVAPYYPIQQHLIPDKEREYRFGITNTIPYETMKSYLGSYGFIGTTALSYDSSQFEATKNGATYGSLPTEADYEAAQKMISMFQVGGGEGADPDAKSMLNSENYKQSNSPLFSTPSDESTDGGSQDGDASGSDGSSGSDDSSNESDKQKQEATTQERVDSAIIAYSSSTMNADNVHDFADVLRSIKGMKYETFLRYYNPLKSEGGDNDIFLARISPAKNTYVPQVLLAGYSSAAGTKMPTNLQTAGAAYDYFSLPSLAPCLASHTNTDTYYGVLNYEMRALLQKAFLDTLPTNVGLPAVEKVSQVSQQLDEAQKTIFDPQEMKKQLETLLSGVGSLAYINAVDDMYTASVTMKDVDAYLNEALEANGQKSGAGSSYKNVYFPVAQGTIPDENVFQEYGSKVPLVGGAVDKTAPPEEIRNKPRYDVYKDYKFQKVEFKDDIFSNMASGIKGFVNATIKGEVSGMLLAPGNPAAMTDGALVGMAMFFYGAQENGGKVWRFDGEYASEHLKNYIASSPSFTSGAKSQASGGFPWDDGVWINIIYKDNGDPEWASAADTAEASVILSYYYRKEFLSMATGSGEYSWFNEGSDKANVEAINKATGKDDIFDVDSLTESNLFTNATAGTIAKKDDFESDVKKAAAALFKKVNTYYSALNKVKSAMPSQMQNAIAWADYKNASDSQNQYQSDPSENNVNITINTGDSGKKEDDDTPVTSLDQAEKMSTEMQDDGSLVGTGNSSGNNLTAKQKRGVEGTTATATGASAAYSITAVISRAQTMTSSTATTYPYSGLINGRMMSGADRYSTMQSHVVDYTNIANGLANDLSTWKATKLVETAQPASASSGFNILDPIGSMIGILNEMSYGMVKATGNMFKSQRYSDTLNKAADNSTSKSGAEADPITDMTGATRLTTYTAASQTSQVNMTRKPASRAAFDISTQTLVGDTSASTASADVNVGHWARDAVASDLGGKLYALMQSIALALVMLVLVFIAIQNLFAYTKGDAEQATDAATTLKIVLPRAIAAVFMVGLPPMGGSTGFQGGGYLLLQLIASIFDQITVVFTTANGTSFIDMVLEVFKNSAANDLGTAVAVFILALVNAFVFLIETLLSFLVNILLFLFFFVAPIAWAFYPWPYADKYNAGIIDGRTKFSVSGLIHSFTRAMQLGPLSAGRVGNQAPSGVSIAFVSAQFVGLAMILVLWAFSLLFVSVAGSSWAYSSASTSQAAMMTQAFAADGNPMNMTQNLSGLAACAYITLLNVLAFVAMYFIFKHAFKNSIGGTLANAAMSTGAGIAGGVASAAKDRVKNAVKDKVGNVMMDKARKKADIDRKQLHDNQKANMAEGSKMAQQLLEKAQRGETFDAADNKALESLLGPQDVVDTEKPKLNSEKYGMDNPFVPDASDLADAKGKSEEKAQETGKATPVSQGAEKDKNKANELGSDKNSAGKKEGTAVSVTNVDAIGKAITTEQKKQQTADDAAKQKAVNKEALKSAAKAAWNNDGAAMSAALKESGLNEAYRNKVKGATKAVSGYAMDVAAPALKAGATAVAASTLGAPVIGAAAALGAAGMVVKEGSVSGAVDKGKEMLANQAAKAKADLKKSAQTAVMRPASAVAAKVNSALDKHVYTEENMKAYADAYDRQFNASHDYDGELADAASGIRNKAQLAMGLDSANRNNLDARAANSAASAKAHEDIERRFKAGKIDGNERNDLHRQENERRAAKNKAAAARAKREADKANAQFMENEANRQDRATQVQESLRAQSVREQQGSALSMSDYRHNHAVSDAKHELGKAGSFFLGNAARDPRTEQDEGLNGKYDPFDNTGNKAVQKEMNDGNRGKKWRDGSWRHQG